MAETMTKAQKRAAMDLAWATYRAESQAIPRSLPFSGFKRSGRVYEGFVEIDDRLFKRYLAAERSIAAVPETKAA
jgi:hypothetical protein